MSDLAKVAAAFRRAMRGETLSWSARVMLNYHFAYKVLPKMCERYGSKRLHAFRMVIERSLSEEPLVCFERELADELLALIKKSAKLPELRYQLSDCVANHMTAEIMKAPSL